MGLIEKLYELKHGERPEQKSQSDEDTDTGCNDHNFGDWELVDDNERSILGDPAEYHDWRHTSGYVAVKYDSRSNGVDKSSPTVVPYSDVRTESIKLSGQKYYLITMKRQHRRECHCGERETSYQPVKYVALHCGEIVAEETDRDMLDAELINHDRNY